MATSRLFGSSDMYENHHRVPLSSMYILYAIYVHSDNLIWREDSRILLKPVRPCLKVS